MTSNRKRKKQAESLGLSPRELELAELLAEVLDNLRWMQILAYSNQYLVNEKLSVEKAERDRILEAATRAVEKDHKLHEWQERLARLKAEIRDIQRRVGDEIEPCEGGADGDPGDRDRDGDSDVDSDVDIDSARGAGNAGEAAGDPGERAGDRKRVGDRKRGGDRDRVGDAEGGGLEAGSEA